VFGQLASVGLRFKDKESTDAKKEKTALFEYLAQARAAEAAG
jgi:hypothetical protein